MAEHFIVSSCLKWTKANRHVISNIQKGKRLRNYIYTYVSQSILPFCFILDPSMTFIYLLYESLRTILIPINISINSPTAVSIKAVYASRGY